PVMLRLRSLTTGRTVAELALAETQRLEVVELFLVRRGSGELVQHWPEGPQGSGVPSNSNIHLSGVLTAINDFASQALKDDGGNLRSFSLDDFQMYLRGSPAYLLAAKCRGTAPAGVEAALDDEFLRLIESNSRVMYSPIDEAPQQLLPPLARSLEAKLAEKQRAIASEAGLGFNPLKALAVMIALPLLIYGGWVTYNNFETAQVRQFADRTIAGMPQLVGYPTQLDVGARGLDLTLTGLVPTSEAKVEVIKRLRDGLPGTAVLDRLTVLPNWVGELEPQITNVRRSLAGIEGEALRASVRRTLARAVRRLDQSVPHLLQLEQSLKEAAQRRVAQSARTSVERDLGALRTLQTRVGTGPVDIGQLNALSAPMHSISEQLRLASGQISKLLVGGAVANDGAHNDAAPVDVLESAEVLSLSAEQLATVAVAVSQSAGVKPPPLVLPAPVEPSAREKLEKWTRNNAVFFGDGLDYRNSQAAQTGLDALAPLITQAKALVRVVGYTDERGSAGRNTSLSQTRAQRVVDALVERGVPRQQLIAVGRISGGEISAAVGSQSNNRRVEFELGFEGEAADQP
ncbi:MAG: OmpA family protein, partial [Hyphomicrobiaceae bacterium]